MKSKDFVKNQLRGSYQWSPCSNTFVIKHAGVEIGARAKSIRKAWSNAKQRLQASKLNDGKSNSFAD